MMFRKINWNLILLLGTKDQQMQNDERYGYRKIDLVLNPEAFYLLANG